MPCNDQVLILSDKVEVNYILGQLVQVTVHARNMSFCPVLDRPFLAIPLVDISNITVIGNSAE